MKYCSKCGQQIHDDATICIHCGCATAVSSTQVAPATQDAPNTGFAVLGFFIPLVGLILYLIFSNNGQPLKAKSAGKGALIGVIVSVAISIVYGIVIGSMIGTLGSYYY